MAGWTNLTPSAAALAAGSAYLYEDAGALKYQGTSGSPATIVAANGALATFSPTWTAYTSTLTNVSNVTKVSSYLQVGKLVFVQFSFTATSSTFVSGTVTMTLPDTATSLPAASSARNISVCNIVANGTTYKGLVLVNGSSSTTTATIQVYNASTTYLTQTNLSSTVPNASGWVSGDSIVGSFFYEAA